jgi:hypothetical protein
MSSVVPGFYTMLDIIGPNCHLATEIHIHHQHQIASLFFHPFADLTDSSYNPSDQSLSSTITLTTESTAPLTDDESSMSTSSWTYPFTAPSHQSLTSSSPTDTDASSTSSSPLLAIQHDFLVDIVLKVL